MTSPSDVLYEFAVLSPKRLGSGPGTLGAHLAEYVRRFPQQRVELTALAYDLCRSIIAGDDA